MVIAMWFFKTEDEKHEKFGGHTDGKHRSSVRQVQNFEHCSEDDDGCAPTVKEIEDSFPFVAGEKHLQSVFISFVFAHCCCPFLFLIVTVSLLWLWKSLFVCGRTENLCKNVSRFDIRMNACRSGQTGVHLSMTRLSLLSFSWRKGLLLRHCTVIPD